MESASAIHHQTKVSVFDTLGMRLNHQLSLPRLQYNSNCDCGLTKSEFYHRIFFVYSPQSDRIPYCTLAVSWQGTTDT